MSSATLPLTRRPVQESDTGLPTDYVSDLICKHLLQRGVLTTSMLVQRLALAGPIIEGALAYLKREGRLEVRAQIGASGNSDLRYGLTDRGRAYVLDALMRDPYVGPAPVTLSDYSALVRGQSIRLKSIREADLQRAFTDAVVSHDIIHRLGPALNSGRAIFLFGAAGTGKTYLAKRLIAALGGTVLIPHAVFVNDITIQVFDPLVHVPVENLAVASGLHLAQGDDPRFVRCARPLVVVGGELTIDMLEVHAESRSGRLTAPLQWRANNGLLLIDDLGRQRASVDAILNRWIVPMEDGQDHLSTNTGQHFTVPFDLALVFSSNLDPNRLADEAFLRRIGYKIEFTPVSEWQYEQIFLREAERRQLVISESAFDFLLSELHRRDAVPLLPCHPRDLLGLAQDYFQFTGEPTPVDDKVLTWAWRNYFAGTRVGLNPARGDEKIS